MSKSTKPLHCWIVADDGKIGSYNQCLGLANRLNLSSDSFFVKAKYPWRLLPPKLWWNALNAVTIKDNKNWNGPWPDVIIASGRQSVAPAIALRKKTGAFLIQILNPYVNLSSFDAVIAPMHDNLEGENLLSVHGVLNHLSDDLLKAALKKGHSLFQSDAKKPVLSVLLGGSSKRYKFSQKNLETLIFQLKELASKNHILVTPSRRTPLKVVRFLKDALPENIALWNGEGENPYFFMMAKADVLLVTIDSISMISEACSTKKPVYILPMEGSSPKISRFVNYLYDHNYAKPFEGKADFFEPHPFNEMERVCVVLEKKLNDFFKTPLKNKK